MDEGGQHMTDPRCSSLNITDEIGLAAAQAILDYLVCIAPTRVHFCDGHDGKRIARCQRNRCRRGNGYGFNVLC